MEKKEEEYKGGPTWTEREEHAREKFGKAAWDEGAHLHIALIPNIEKELDSDYVTVVFGCPGLNDKLGRDAAVLKQLIEQVLSKISKSSDLTKELLARKGDGDGKN